jgi:hypothetical protein
VLNVFEFTLPLEDTVGTASDQATGEARKAAKNASKVH